MILSPVVPPLQQVVKSPLIQAKSVTGSGPPPVTNSRLLLENGDFFLLQSNDKILLE